NLDEFTVYSGAATLDEAINIYREVEPEFDGSEVAQSALDLLTIPSSVTSSKLSLPKSNSFGVEIVWESSDAQYISPDQNGWGNVTRPAIGSGNAVVTLTATATYGNSGVSKTRQFTITVPALTEDEGEEAAKYLQPNGLANVTVLDEYLQNASHQTAQYLLSFDTDRLLVEFRKN